jgi:hypothetical protein
MQFGWAAPGTKTWPMKGTSDILLHSTLSLRNLSERFHVQLIDTANRITTLPNLYL